MILSSKCCDMTYSIICVLECTSSIPLSLCPTFELGIILLRELQYVIIHFQHQVQTQNVMFQTAARVLTARTELFMTDSFWMVVNHYMELHYTTWKCRFQSQMLNQDMHVVFQYVSSHDT